MKKTIKLLVLAVCIALFVFALVSCGCSNNGNDCAHEWNAGATTKTPTCIAEGTKTYTCLLCSETYTESIEMLEHTKLFTDALDGTHNVACSYCTLNEYVNHTPTDDGEVHEASCTEAEYTLHTCKDCNASYKLYTPGSVELGHDWGDWVTSVYANCENEGALKHSCTVCFEEETIVTEKNPNVHDFGIATITSPATCVSEGNKLFVCGLCGSDKNEAIPVTTQHTWSDGDADGTGWVTQSCTVDNCDESRKYYDASTLENADVNIDDLPDEDVSLGLQNATIQIPSDVISQIKGDESGNQQVEISATTADKSTIDTSSMSDEEKSRLESTEVYDFGISIGGNSIGNFNSQVTVTIPYKLGENEDKEGIVIWYVTDSGSIEVVEAVYDETSETVTFSVSHFSYYAVAYKETQAMKCKRGLHDMEETTIKYEPTCYTYGYTVFQCSCCLATEPGKIQNRLDHSFGAFMDAEVDCENGGYRYRVCENDGCGYVQTAEYVRANGHTINTVPTCTDGVYCEICNKMVKTPLGHDYTSWTIDKNASEYEDGQKSRLCRKCGNKETVAIVAGTGVDAAHLENYQDLFEFILLELVGESKGTTTISYNISGMDMESVITLNVSEDNFVAFIKSDGLVIDAPTTDGSLVVGPTTDGEEAVDQKISTIFYYDNGSCYIELVEGASTEIRKTDINSALLSATGLPFDTLFNTIEENFAAINAMVEQYAGMIKQVIDAIPEKFAGQIPQLYNAIETTYAYLVLRLGFDTNLKMTDGMTTPTAKDVIESLGAFLTKSEVNGESVYTFDIQSAIDEVKATLEAIKGMQDATLGEFIYFCYEDAIKTIYPNADSFESFLASLKADFSGDTTVGQAFVKLASYLLKLDFTIDEIYDAFDSIMEQIQPMPEDAPEGSAYHDMLAQYANMTLDQLLEMLGQMEMNPPSGDDNYNGGYDNGGNSGSMGGDSNFFPDQDKGNIGLDKDELPSISLNSESDSDAAQMTMDAIWAQLEAMLSQMTLSQMTIPVQGQEMTFVQAVQMIEEMLNSVDVSFTVSFTVNSNGDLRLASILGDLSMIMTNPENPSETATNKLGGINISFDASKTEVAVPDSLKPYVNTSSINYHTDSQGNLIISGIGGKDYVISLEGEISLPYNEILTKDEVLSKELGVEVYYSYSYQYYYSDQYVKVGDKYYRFEHIPTGLMGVDKDSLIPDPTIDKSLKLADILANPSIVLPSSDASPIGTYNRTYDIFHTPIGFMYKNANDEWIMIGDFDVDGFTTTHYSYGNNNVESVRVSLNIDSADELSFNDAVSQLKFYMIESEYSIEPENVHLFGGELGDTISHIVLATQNHSLSYLHCYGYFDNDELYLVSYKPFSYTLPGGKYVYVLTEDVTEEVKLLLETYEFIDAHTVQTTYYLGSSVVKNAVHGTLARKHYTYEYFYKVDNDLYIEFSQDGVVRNVDINLYETTITLPNQKTMYVCSQEGNYYFGYVELGNGYFIQTCALCYGDTVEAFEYRNASAGLHTYIDSNSKFEQILNINDYITTSNDSVIISNEFFAKLNKLTTLEHSVSINVSINAIDLVFADGSSTVMAGSLTFEELCIPYSSAILEGGITDNSLDNVNWYYHFGKVESNIDFDIITNKDGTVSFYYNGMSLELNYNVSNMDISSIGSVNSDLTNDCGTPIYQVKEDSYSSSTYVLLGGKLYSWSWYNNIKASYILQSASYKITNWRFADLRYMATSNVDGEELDIYETVVACKNPWHEFDMTVYTTFVDGKLLVLGGCEKIGYDSIQFETLVTPNEYFGNLIPVIPTADKFASSFLAYVNGSSSALTVYTGFVQYVEPDSICLDGDMHAGEYRVYATINNKYVSIFDNYVYLENILSLGNQVNEADILKDGYKFNGNYTSVYYNGTFTFSEYQKVYQSYHYYFKLAGKYYSWESSAWNYYTYSYDEFVNHFYERIYLYGVKEADGSITLYTGDEFSSTAELYYGELNINDANEVIKMEANFIDGYDEVYQYTFFVVPEGAQVLTVDGTELYISLSGESFAKAAENVYISGIAIENKDGSFEFDPYNFSDAYVNNSTLVKLLANKHVKVSETGILTFTKDFYETFKNSDGYISVYATEYNSSYYIGEISIEELFVYFDLANEK